jgi:hypothetical protein
MPSIKKSELDGLKARVKSSYDFALEESRRASEERNLFRDREKVWRAHLWNTEQELRDLKELLSEAESRITERNQTVAKLLHNGINLAAEHRKQQQAAIDYWVEAFAWREKYIKLLAERDGLRSELALQKEIPKMVEQVVHYVNEWNPGTFYSTHEPDPIPANPPVPPEIKPKKSYGRLAVGLLIGALIGMTALFLREAHIIQEQRELITEMYNYLITNCPLPQ